MNVLLTGATGLVGSHVARRLVEAGHAVRVIVRPSSKLDNLEDLDLTKVDADVTKPETLAGALEGCDALVHTAGVASWSPVDTERIFRVNVEGTRSLLAAGKAAGVRRTVVTSSVAAVGGDGSAKVLDEDSPWELGPLNVPYLTAKRRGEEVALALSEPGFEVVAVNPGFVLGPGDVYGSSSAIALQVVKGRMPAYVEGGVSIVDARDVAQGHVAALEVGRPGQRYILGGENLTMTAFMEAVGKVAGVKPPRRVPFWIAQIPARLADWKARRTGVAQPLSMNLLRASSLYTYASSARAEAELGYTYRPVETSLADTFRYFLSVGRLNPFTPELEALAG